VGTVLRAGKRQATVEARVFSERPGEVSSLVAVALGSVAAVR
jgi:acyl-coenzyme A thioesterase PaaI-like protein